jgi:hypothetical protein
MSGLTARRGSQPHRAPHPAIWAAAAAQKPHITPADFSIVNQPGANSYPISGYSWALVYTHQTNQATGQKLVAMLDWLTHDGQAFAAPNGYVPLPPQIRDLAHAMLQHDHRARRGTPAELSTGQPFRAELPTQHFTELTDQSLPSAG